MGNRRTLIAVGAAVLAAVAGLLVFVYVSGADTRAADKVDKVQAFVAVDDIPKGTTGDSALADGLIEAEDVLRGSVPPAAVTDSSLLGGKVAAATIQAKQYITDASFVAPSEAGGGSLAAAMGDKGRVAVTVSVDAEHGVAGQIAPGDRVDIAVVTEGSAAYILSDVKVLSVGQKTTANATGGNDQASATATDSGLITFELSPEEALAVVAANKSGSLYLTLRPIAASSPSRESSVAASGR